jgi:hypothetical protein
LAISSSSKLHMENASSFSISMLWDLSNIIKEFWFALDLPFAFLSQRFATF